MRRRAVKECRRTTHVQNLTLFTKWKVRLAPAWHELPQNLTRGRGANRGIKDLISDS